MVNADHQSFAVPNLYIVDGSVLPTQGSANPALTIMALAARCADRLIAGAAPDSATPGRSADDDAEATVTAVDGRAPTRSPPTGPKADGTLAWDSTVMVVVKVGGGGPRGDRLDLRRPGRQDGHRRETCCRW